MRATVFAIFFFVLPTTSFAQKFKSEDARDKAPVMEVDYRWYEAKKLSRNAEIVEDRKKVYPIAFEYARKPQNIKTGTVHHLSYWVFKVKSIIDDKTMTLQMGDLPVILLEGYPTEDIADDESVVVYDRAEAMGTRVVSGKKLRVFRMLSSEETKAFEDKLDSDGYLEYRYVNGDSFRGKLIKQDGDSVVFTVPSGKEVAEHIDALDSSARQQLVAVGTRLGIKVTLPKEADGKLPASNSK